jgi:tRNA(fMet)-specific endonuclease VapC
MRRFLLDTGIAGKFINRRDGVFERGLIETSHGNRIGICHPVLAELVYGVEYSASRDRNMQRLRLALSAWTI